MPPKSNSPNCVLKKSLLASSIALVLVTPSALNPITVLPSIPSMRNLSIQMRNLSIRFLLLFHLFPMDIKGAARK
ncbi:hypothetical protein RJT34_09551 [Clitoria ternatea]|uniref:Uncharacterized protein n=1 Tax=Clitoria ternatea TaxID=43366 RepID=A0AAN9PWF5_CLITE